MSLTSTLTTSDGSVNNATDVTQILTDKPLPQIKNPAPQKNPTSPLDVQIGGDHYKKLKIQPMQYSMANKLDACQHTAIKYITRFRDKGGVGDLEKAKHCIDMLIAFELEK